MVLLLLLIGLLAAVSSGRAAPSGVPQAGAEADSLIGPEAPDSVETSEIDQAEGDSLDSGSSQVHGGVRRVAIPRRGGFDQPRWVMLRSLALPGWGQLHNGSWKKAVLVAGGEAFLAYKVVDDKRRLDRLLGEVEAARADSNDADEAVSIDRYNSQLDRYQSREWLLGGLVVYALLDAYIDAHFRDFKIEFENGDPALPGSRQLRLSLRWNY